MSQLSNMMTSALSVVSSFKAAALQYATSLGGTYNSLTGFVIHQDRVAEPVYDDNNRVVSQIRRGFCKGPVSPLMAIGYCIKDTKQSPALIWAVEGVMVAEQQIITLTRKERVGVAGPDRGASA